MRITDQGSLYIVCVSRAEVEQFKRRWPCSGLPDRAIRFQFDKRNGDLVDLHPYDVDGEAVAALAMDAQAEYIRREGVRRWLGR